METKIFLICFVYTKNFCSFFFSFSLAESKPILEDTTFGVAQKLPSSANIYIQLYRLLKKQVGAFVIGSFEVDEGMLSQQGMAFPDSKIGGVLTARLWKTAIILDDSAGGTTNQMEQFLFFQVFTWYTTTWNDLVQSILSKNKTKNKKTVFIYLFIFYFCTQILDDS